MTLKASPLNGSWSLGFRVMAVSGSSTAEPCRETIGVGIRCREHCCATPATPHASWNGQDMSCGLSEILLRCVGVCQLTTVRWLAASRGWSGGTRHAGDACLPPAKLETLSARTVHWLTRQHNSTQVTSMRRAFMAGTSSGDGRYATTASSSGCKWRVRHQDAEQNFDCHNDKNLCV